jgi:DNA-binding NtrC family response regulator
MPDQTTDTSAFEILVVDDEIGARELLSEYLRGEGFTVSEASDGRAAITALERHPTRFHVILTDIQMPGANGFDVLRAAKAANDSCYVVIITGFASIDSATEAVRLGAYDYLSKPFTLGQIEVILRRIQDREALEAENRRLTRSAQTLESPEAKVVERLDAIDVRLTHVERAIDRLYGLVQSMRP